MSVREEILSKLFPDHSIQVTEEVQIKVYPLGVRHLSKFSNKLTWIFSEIGKITVTQKGADESSEAFQGRVGKELLSSLGPILLTELLDLLSECCEVIYKGKKTKEIESLQARIRATRNDIVQYRARIIALEGILKVVVPRHGRRVDGDSEFLVHEIRIKPDSIEGLNKGWELGITKIDSGSYSVKVKHPRRVS